MLEQLPPKCKAIFFPFKENQNSSGSTSIVQQLEEHSIEPVKASFLQHEQLCFF